MGEWVLNALVCVVAVLLVLTLRQLLIVLQRRRGYIAIDQDTNGLYANSLMRAKDSWESMPRHGSP